MCCAINYLRDTHVISRILPYSPNQTPPVFSVYSNLRAVAARAPFDFRRRRLSHVLCVSLDSRPFPPPAINIRVTFEPCAELGRFSSHDAWHGRHHYALRLTRAIVNVMLLASECERLCTSVRAVQKSCITDGLHVFPSKMKALKCKTLGGIHMQSTAAMHIH